MLPDRALNCRLIEQSEAKSAASARADRRRDLDLYLRAHGRGRRFADHRVPGTETRGEAQARCRGRKSGGRFPGVMPVDDDAGVGKLS